MKLLQAFKQQVESLGEVKRVWLTTFNLNIEFVERHLLPVILGMDPPRNRLDYEGFQWELAQRGIDFRVFYDKRMLQPDQLKRTAISLHPVTPRLMIDVEGMGEESLFHPKVIFLQNTQGEAVLGAGSANLTVSGWGRNQEVFAFRQVSHSRQYQQIRRFFGSLDEHLGGGLELPEKRKFSGSGPHWEFVHSFQGQTFIEQLLGAGGVKRLSVWSPYLAGDIPVLLGKLSEVAQQKELVLQLVADRLEGRYFRTPWSDALATTLAEGAVCFFDNPSQRHESTEMTHAKVWLAHLADTARLAIGSWNFTQSGTSSFDKRNVEAGILFECAPSTEVVGKRLSVTATDFASQEQLQEDSLQVPPELPFDVQVRFDWQQAVFSVTGIWHSGQPTGTYQLRLPGVERPLVLHWKGRRTGKHYSLESFELTSLENESLLADHSYAVILKGETLYRGVILETGQEYRRAQAFDSLKELFDCVIAGVDPTGGDMSVLRGSLRGSGGPDEDVPQPSVKVEQDALSYFRLFQAIELYCQRLQQSKSREELDKWLFSYPGCVEELAAKTRLQIQDSPPSVFNWFLAQEVNALYSVAVHQLERWRERYARRQVPERWESLTVKLPKLPKELSNQRRYLRRVLEECGYATH